MPQTASSMSTTGPWVTGVADLAARVRPGSRVSVGGVHFTRAPVAALLALVDAEASDLHYVAWSGGLPLEILLAGDAVASAEFCFSAMDVFGSAPRFRAAAENGRIRLIERTALNLIVGLRAEAENLGWDLMQEPAGSALADGLGRVGAGRGRAPLVRVEPIPVDVMLLHAQRADDDGNVEIAGARGTDLSTIYAAKEVLVTVEERVAKGMLGSPRSVIIPRSHITAIATAPRGAFPTSCLPYYGTDYLAIQRFLETPQTAKAIHVLRAGGLDESDAGASAVPPTRPLVEAMRSVRHIPPAAEWTVPELMAVHIARTVDDDSVCSFGSASPLPAVAYLLAKQTHAPRALLMSLNGGYVDIDARPMSLSFAEQIDFETAACHTGGDETYHWYYQSGRVSHEVVGAAQIDGRGATNNMWITRADGTRIRLPGQGGMGDVANLHRDFVIYLPRQDRRNTVRTLDMVSAQRVWSSREVRESYGLRPGTTKVITNLCVFERDAASDRLQVTELHPGVELADVQAATGFDVVPARGMTRTSAPTAAELTALRERVDPLGVSRLDFVPARERFALIREIIDAERAAGAAAQRQTSGKDTAHDFA